jgi:hypothetical protein
MDNGQYIKPNTLLPIFFGIIISLTLIFIGDLDDAPGLSAIGLILGTGLIFMGISNINKVNKKVKTNFILPLFYGILGIIAVFILFFDDEFKDFPHFFSLEFFFLLD